MLLQSVDTSEYISNKIDLGRQGEHDVRQIVFDLSPLIKTYGDGSAVLVFKRSDANAPYVVPAVRDGNKLIWTVSATDTSVKGCGRAEIRWNTEGGLAKTLIYITVTAASLPTNTIQPAGFKSWFDKMVEYIDSKTIESVELNDDTSVTFNFSNETSVTTPPLKGEKGETGPQGTKGDKGDRGDRGPTGATGETGPRGLKGDKGDTGDPGPVGLQGPKGDTGPQGATGPRGLKGDKGDRGATGATGPKGDKGDRGPQGEKGDTGEQGPKGDKGDTGEQGPKGDKGDKGDTGDIGPTGPAGADGADGEDGADGKSAYEYAVDGGYTGTEQEFAQKLAEEGVLDVQVDGTSVVTDGVGNVPKATLNQYGVVRPGSGLGLTITTSGSLAIAKSNVTQTKNGVSDYAVIVPANQHMSTFYGLAKAAGDATQSASANAVGAYTDEAKVAIQKMLGIYEAPWELIKEETFTNETQTDYRISADENSVPFELTDIALLVETPTQDSEVVCGAQITMHIVTGNDSARSVIVECGSYTQAANATGHVYSAHMRQHGNSVEIWRAGNATYSNTAVLAYRVARGLPGLYDANTDRIYFSLTQQIVYVNWVDIKNLSGTGYYKLYGKRKWQ